MNIPEPRWIMGDDAALGINEPPENHLPDEERKVVDEMRDEVGGLAYEMEAQLKTLSEWSIRMETAIPAAIKAMNELADALGEFYDNTVGDDWDEPDWIED